jgi:hypothetical protein
MLFLASSPTHASDSLPFPWHTQDSPAPHIILKSNAINEAQLYGLVGAHRPLGRILHAEWNCFPCIKE